MLFSFGAGRQTLSHFLPLRSPSNVFRPLGLIPPHKLPDMLATRRNLCRERLKAGRYQEVHKGFVFFLRSYCLTFLAPEFLFSILMKEQDYKGKMNFIIVGNAKLV